MSSIYRDRTRVPGRAGSCRVVSVRTSCTTFKGGSLRPQVCAIAVGQVASIVSGSPLSPSQPTNRTSLMPRLRRSASTPVQNPHITVLAGPQPEDVALAVGDDAQYRIGIG